MVDTHWDPADLTRYRSDRTAVDFVDTPAELAAAETVRRSGRTLVVGLIAVALLGAGTYVALRPTTHPVVVAAAKPAPVTSPAPPVPTPTPTPATSQPAEAVRSVDRILAITYPTRVAALTPRDERRILQLVSRPVGADQRVLVSGFAGYDWATEEGAKAMSLARARTIQELLRTHGIESSIVAYGSMPADSILGEAMTAAVPSGHTDNLLAFVSVVHL